VVAKCWEPNPKGYFTVSKSEPIRPIDPSAWVAHTQAHTGAKPRHQSNNYAHHPTQPPSSRHHNNHNRLTHSISSFGSSSSLASSIADSSITSSTYSDVHGGLGGNYNINRANYQHHYNQQQQQNPHFHAMNQLHNQMGLHQQHHHHHQTMGTTMGNDQLNLTTDTDMETVVRSMAAADSGLDVRDRHWLKITIPMAFIGSDVVDWLFNHVEGFPDRRDARKYACNLLKHGYIRHTVNKNRFSEQCYYVFGDFNQSTLNSQCGIGPTLGTVNEESENDFDSVSEYNERENYYMLQAHQQNNMPPPGSYNQKSNVSIFTSVLTIKKNRGNIIVFG
jgi:hypothetical protein